MAKTSALIPWLQGMLDTFHGYEDEINSYLMESGLSTIQLGEYERIIKQQINTAQNKFTMAFVGEFNSGKSTIINTLLDLGEHEKLSCLDSPDTALSIRIMHKEKDCDFDAEIIFKPGTFENERVDWDTAKKYTSQVAIDEDPSLAIKVSNIDEVRYYIDKDIMTVCNILDLPGTGTGTHREHTELTNTKIFEAEVVFWVVSTSSEVDRTAIANLEKISSKIIPVINVWQFEKEGIKGEYTAEETKKDITEKYSEYFSNKEEPIVYYGREIEYALQHGLEVKNEWGRDCFVECLERIVYSESIDSDDANVERVKKTISKELRAALHVIEEKQESLKDVNNEIEHDESELDVLETSLYSTYQSVDTKIKDISKATAKKIIDYFLGVTDAYIEDEMQSANLQLLIRSIGRGKKEALKKEMEEKYRNEYLKVQDKPCWYDEVMNDFVEDVKTLLNGEYASFKIKAKEIQDKTSFIDMPNDFIASIIQQSINAFLESMGSVMVTIISTIVLVLVPGGEIIDNISIALLGKSTIGTDRITKKKENIKSRARLSINIQKNGVVHGISSIGQDINKECQKNIEKIITGKRNDSELKKRNFEKTNNSFISFINIINDYLIETESF